MSVDVDDDTGPHPNLKRILEQREIIAEMATEIARLRGALLLVEEWRTPYRMMGALYGENGVRDHFRRIAREALQMEEYR